MRKNHWYGKPLSCLLILTLLLMFCAGCGPGNGEGGGGPESASAPEWTAVQPATEINTLEVVLVIDTSTSNWQNDPNRNGLEAACMFLDALYASASKQESDRLPGSKGAKVSVVLYNDDITSYSDILLDLASSTTADELRKFVSTAEIPREERGDNALIDALDAAVNILLYEQHSKGQREEGLSERSVILLFTDGYTGYLPGDTAASLPDFGDTRQEQWKTVLNRAKENNYEIFVSMLDSGGGDEGWDEFRKIADYTKRNFMEKVLPALIRIGMDPRFEGMPRSKDDLIWSDDYTMLSPAFLSDPMYGGGAFPDPNGGEGKVTYLSAAFPAQLMSFYTTMAANMLSGSSAEEHTPRIEKIPETKLDAYCYDVEVPDSGISALMCFFFSDDGISEIYLTGPDREDSNKRVNYEPLIFNHEQGPTGWARNEYGWAQNGTMRNGWYPHINSSDGEWQSNIAALTIIDPAPGTWRLYLRGKNNNRFLHTYTALVNGAKVSIDYRQGNGAADSAFPVTKGDFEVRINDHNGTPMPEKFYDSLTTECCATRIPPWIPISGEADITALMENPVSWVNQAATSYQKPEKWLIQMSGGEIQFKPGKDSNGNPLLTGHFDIPLPGLYYVTLNMTSGKGNSLISYSKSFWVTYESKTGRQVPLEGLNKDVPFNPPYFPEAWGKIANTRQAEDLVLNIEAESVQIIPDQDVPWDFATVQIDSANPQSLILHSNQKGRGTLSFDVTTEYGEKWTLDYDVIVK